MSDASWICLPEGGWGVRAPREARGEVMVSRRDGTARRVVLGPRLGTQGTTGIFRVDEDEDAPGPEEDVDLAVAQ